MRSLVGSQGIFELELDHASGVLTLWALKHGRREDSRRFEIKPDAEETADFTDFLRNWALRLDREAGIKPHRPNARKFEVAG